MKPMHSNLAENKWCELSIYEQMGNIGSEVGRVASATRNNDKNALRQATDRALELFDLTISDPRRRDQLKEIIRSREVFIDALSDKPEFGSSIVDLDKYFMQFAMAARLGR